MTSLCRITTGSSVLEPATVVYFDRLPVIPVPGIEHQPRVVQLNNIFIAGDRHDGQLPARRFAEPDLIGSRAPSCTISSDGERRISTETTVTVTVSVGGISIPIRHGQGKVMGHGLNAGVQGIRRETRLRRIRLSGSGYCHWSRPSVPRHKTRWSCGGQVSSHVRQAGSSPWKQPSGPVPHWRPGPRSGADDYHHGRAHGCHTLIIGYNQGEFMYLVRSARFQVIRHDCRLRRIRANQGHRDPRRSAGSRPGPGHNGSARDHRSAAIKLNLPAGRDRRRTRMGGPEARSGHRPSPSLQQGLMQPPQYRSQQIRRYASRQRRPLAGYPP